MATTGETPSTPDAEISSPSQSELVTPTHTTEKNEIDISWPTPVIGTKETESNRPQEHKKRPRRDPMAVERANLLTMCKLVIKELLDSSISQGRMLEDNHVPLQQFFVVIEHILRHGIKPKKGILRDKREFWHVLEQVEKFMSDAVDITMSVRDMPNVKTPLGRARAWLRLALMQKRLADYFRCLIEKRDEILNEFYEAGALMMDEEVMVIAGLLVGLNVIDCNLGIKDEDLDQPMGVIDFSLYLRDSNFNKQESLDEDPEENSKMAAILDQKNYLEELNRHLNATVTNLQQKSEGLQTANTLMKEDLAIAKNNLILLQEENGVLRNNQHDLLQVHEKQIKTAREDLDTERETYQTSRVGLDSMYHDMQKKLHEETQMRLDVEKELELQIQMKQEMEIALRLLEKDIHEKQDTVVALRKQLDEIKQINLDVYTKLQDCESFLEHKTDLVSKLEEKTAQMAGTIKSMEDKDKHAFSDKLAAEETSRKLGQMLADKDVKRCALETDLRIEREWRATLQSSLEKEKEKVSRMATEMQQIVELRKERDTLQRRCGELQTTGKEQEKALSELGSHLSESKLKMEDLKEAHQSIREAQWAVDKDVSTCKQCEKAFSVSRRKHHCRNCGEIYCNECSDNKMPLPSSAKPVRVCDSCQTALLHRYSAN